MLSVVLHAIGQAAETSCWIVGLALLGNSLGAGIEYMQEKVRSRE